MPQLEATKSRRRALKSSGIRLPSINKQPSRQASGKMLEVQYFKIIKTLIEPYFADVRERLIPALPEIVESFKQSRRVDDIKLDQTYGEIITRSIRDVKIGIALQIPESLLRVRTEDQASASSRFQKRQFDRQIKTVLGVNPIISEPYLEPMVQSFVERNAALIKDIPDQSIARVETKLRTGIEAGDSLKTLTATVKDELRIAKNRAKLIARDQTNKFLGNLNELRQTSLGVEEYTWSTSKDERVRPTHQSKEGKTFKWSDPPDDTGPPGHDINCFPSDSLIVPTAPINRLYRRIYRGELTILVLADGSETICTPNHPIFTSAGWKAMKDVNIGDQIAEINSKSSNILYRNTQERKSKFIKLFNSFSLLWDIESCHAASSDFHGDGIINQTVDIINIDWSLMDALITNGSQRFDKKIFTDTIIDALGRIKTLKLSGFNLAAFRSFTTSRSDIRLASYLFSLLIGGVCKSDNVGLAAIADRYVLALKQISQSFSRNTEFFGLLQNRASIDILFDKKILIKLLRIHCLSVMSNGFESDLSHFLAEIVGIDIKDSGNLAEISPASIGRYSTVNKISSEFYSGHVYNLQTFNNWYGSTTTKGEQLIFSNCRCTALPNLENFK